jgi:succinyl-CoA synthetase alpha subunit
VRELPGSNVAVVSVPGEYAALEAHEALTAGLDVLLFSDNVSIPDEVELKDRAAGLGRLLMGPGPERRCSVASASASPTWSVPVRWASWPPPGPGRRRP